MLNRIFVVDSVTLSSTGTAVSSYVPWEQTTRKLPTQVVVKATGQGAYVRLSNDASAATNVDVLVQGGDHVVLSVQGRRWVSVLSDGASSTVSVGALSTGVSGSAASLDLAFAGAATLDPLVTFTRASTATFFNSAGVLTSAAINAPRFDYNPSTLAAQGFLIEESRANSLLRSAEFDNASWIKTRATVTANTATAPDGTTSADSIVEDGTAANTHDLRQGGITNSATTNWTLSFFLKAVNRTWALIELQNASATSNRARAWFNLQTGVVGTGNAAGSGITYVSHSIQNVGNGWYRCVVVGTVDVSVTSIQAWVEGTIADNTANYDGVNGQTSVYIWGAQLEAGAFPTSYIPTTTTALTRSADVASVNTLSPWWNASEGTFYVEGSCGSLTNSPIFVMPHDGTSNNYLNTPLLTTAGLGRLAGVVGGAAWTNVNTANSTTANTTFKSASAFKASDQAICLNAGTVATGANASVPVVTTLKLGDWRTSGNSINGYLRRITYYPRRLSNAELQTITA